MWIISVVYRTGQRDLDWFDRYWIPVDRLLSFEKATLALHRIAHGRKQHWKRVVDHVIVHHLASSRKLPS